MKNPKFPFLTAAVILLGIAIGLTAAIALGIDVVTAKQLAPLQPAYIAPKAHYSDVYRVRGVEE